MNDPISVSDAAYGVVDVAIPARAEWVIVARLAVTAAASRLPFTLDAIEDIKLALAEACTYCIAHGAGGERLEITCEATADAMTVTVRDRGTAVRLEAIDPADPALADRADELGVFLIRALMDEVEYRTHPRDGVSLVMTKRIAD